MFHRCITIPLFCLFLLLSSCTDRENHPKNSISFSSIESAIRAELKSNLISAKKNSAYFEEDMLPDYSTLSLSSISELTHAKKDISFLENAVAVLHRDSSNADIIAVFKSKDGQKQASIDFAASILEMQNSIKNNFSEDEKEKIRKNIIETVGNYVIYITCDEPQKMKKAILDVIK